jgi:hypothetical protein
MYSRVVTSDTARWRSLATISLALTTASSLAADSSGAFADCAQLWQVMAESAGRDRVALETSWKGYAARCAGTSIYEYRLATLAEQNGRRAEAIDILDSALASDLPLKVEMRAIKLGMEFSAAQFAIPRDATAAKKAHEELEAVLVESPGLVVAMHQLAMQRLELEDFAGAEQMSRQAMAKESGAWQPRRTLFLALVAQDEFPEARELIRPTLELHDRLFTDVEFMLAASYCYLKVGDLMTAEQVLRALRSKVPGVQEDVAFRKLALRILAEKEKNGAKPQD